MKEAPTKGEGSACERTFLNAGWLKPSANAGKGPIETPPRARRTEKQRDNCVKAIMWDDVWVSDSLVNLLLCEETGR